MHETPAARDDLEKKERRRPWLMMGGITLVMLGVLFSLIVWHDGPPPDDSVMAVPSSGQAKAKNPLSVFCLELEKLSTASLPEITRESRRAGLAARNNRQPRANPATMREVAIRKQNVEDFLQKEVALLEAFTRLMQTNADAWQWPNQSSVRARIAPVYLQKLNAFRSALYLKVEMLVWQGRAEEAVTLSLQICRLGKRLCSAGGGSREFLNSVYVAHTGQLALEHALTAAEPSPQIMRRCIDELAAEEGPQRDEVLLTLKTDYHHFKNCALQKDFAAAMGNSGTPGTDEKLLGLLFFKPNQTLAELLAHELPVMHGLHKDWHAAYAAANAREIAQRAENSRGLLQLAHPNFAGRAAAWDAAHGSVYKLEHVLDSIIRNRQIRLVLALRLYTLDTGSLPNQLQDLVPAYLPEVPEDAYSGKPMLWSASKQTVYSVGDNMKDDGAHGDPEHLRADDLVTPYWWMNTDASALSR